MTHFAVTILLAVVCGVQTFRINRLEHRLDGLAREIEDWLRRQPASRTTERKGTEVTDETPAEGRFRRSWESSQANEREA